MSDEPKKKSHHGPGERKGERVGLLAGKLVGKLQPPDEPPLLVRTPNGPRFAKGHKVHGGRKYDPVTGKWSPNRVTSETRKLLFEFVKSGFKTAKEDYARAKRRSPVKALAVLTGAAEYVLPRLSRMEQTGPGGGPVTVQIVRFVRAAPAPPKQNDVPPDEGGEE